MIGCEAHFSPMDGCYDCEAARNRSNVSDLRTQLAERNAAFNDLEDDCKIFIKERDEAREQLAAAELVVEMFRLAYTVDAVAEWFDQEGDSGKATIAAYDKLKEKKNG